MKKLVLISFLILSMPVIMTAQDNTKAKNAGEIIASIIKNTGAPAISGTVDVIKEGNQYTPVTGIVTTMFATMKVLKEAVARKCNLVIVHEPLYYNHRDDTQAFAGDPVFTEKQKYIRDNKLVIWRFHDYIHSIRPDGILAGMVSKLGWKNYMVNGRYDQFTIPETTLEDLLKSLKKTFPGNAFYVVGRPEMRLKNIRLAPGAPGSSSHIKLLEDNNTDVVIGGESPQWETYEYARDAVDQGRNKAVIFLGHIPSEEAGMEWCAGWLKGFIKDTPVYFISSGPSYWSF